MKKKTANRERERERRSIFSLFFKNGMKSVSFLSLQEFHSVVSFLFKSK